MAVLILGRVLDLSGLAEHLRRAIAHASLVAYPRAAEPLSSGECDPSQSRHRMLRNRDALVLAALAAGGREALTPVQAQKLFFLIDRNVASKIGGPLYAFAPYNYGPFDRRVYADLERLADAGTVELVANRNWNDFRLSATGLSAGQSHLSDLDQSVQDYFRRANEFVRSLSFTQLVSAIYRAYPEMKANSVFQED